jgi:hypothetical protein
VARHGHSHEASNPAGTARSGLPALMIMLPGNWADRTERRTADSQGVRVEIDYHR